MRKLVQKKQVLTYADFVGAAVDMLDGEDRDCRSDVDLWLGGLRQAQRFGWQLAGQVDVAGIIGRDSRSTAGGRRWRSRAPP